jgi:alkylation response protein AidB-like acyl-CoA dehydrogenase
VVTWFEVNPSGADSLALDEQARAIPANRASSNRQWSTSVDRSDRSFSHAPTERPSDDPLLQRLLGELESTAYIAKAAVLDAADAIAAADASMRNGVPDAKLAIEAQLKSAKVKVHIDAVAPEAATRLLELGGASASSRKRNLDRHWRNIRTITLHNPVAYKARVIGQNLLHGTPVPSNAYF